jgi:hypothetical protein
LIEKAEAWLLPPNKESFMRRLLAPLVVLAFLSAACSTSPTPSPLPSLAPSSLPSPTVGPSGAPTMRPGVRAAACPLTTIGAAITAFEAAPFWRVTNSTREDPTIVGAMTYLSYLGPDELDLIVLNADIKVASSIIAIGKKSWSMQLNSSWVAGGPDPLGRPVNQTAALLVDGWKLAPDESWDSVWAGDHCAYMPQDRSLRVELNPKGSQLAKIVEQKADGSYAYDFFDFATKPQIQAPLP